LEPDPPRRRRRRAQGRRRVPGRRRLQLHHRANDRRGWRAHNRVSTGTSPAAARPWLRHYDYWVRSNLSYPGRSLSDVLNLPALERPDRPATLFLGAELTFLDLKKRADSLAVSLARLGIVKGDRVGIMLPNCPQYIFSAFAVLRLGAIV